MFGDNFTGDKGVYLKIYNHLLNEGFYFSENTKPVHTGNNEYEFEECYGKLRDGKIYKIKARLVKGKVIYKKIKIGEFLID